MKIKNVLFQICFMLGLAAWLSFQACAQADAGDQTAVGAFAPVSTRILSDPLFLPLKGQIYGMTDYTFSDLRTDGFNARTGVKNYYEKDFIDTLSQNFAYGITNDVTVRVTEGFSWEREEVMLGNSSSASSVKDTSNPDFGATYRVLDQSAYPVDFDLSASYTPNFNINGGYTASGLQMTSLTGSIGRQMKAVTVQLTGSAEYYGVTKNKYLDEKYGQSWLYHLGFNTQTRLTDRFSVNCGIDYIFPDTQKNYSADSDEKDVWGNYIQINTALNYQIIPNKLVGSITYSYAFFSMKEKYSDPSFDNENVNGLSGHFAGVRLQYLF